MEMRVIIPTMTALSLCPALVVLCVAGMTMAAPSKGSPEAGRKIYLESCQSCHGPTGKGDSDVAAHLTPPPSNLTTKATQVKTDTELRTIILKGRPGTAMASFDGAFDDAQLADVIALIRSIRS